MYRASVGKRSRRCFAEFGSKCPLAQKDFGQASKVYCHSHSFQLLPSDLVDVGIQVIAKLCLACM